MSSKYPLLADYETWDGWNEAMDSYDSTKTTTTYFRCNETHPELTILNGKVVGASCYNPRSGYDIYIGLDTGMKKQVSEFPWNKKKGKDVVEVCFPITDMKVPTNVEQFKKMIFWLCKQLREGKRIHIGCMGGHGRTGLVLAALISKATKIKDPIAWVRKNHCKKAVESVVQIKFLVQHYGMPTAVPTKEPTTRKKKQKANGKGKGKEWAQNKSSPGTVSYTGMGDPVYHYADTKASIW